MPANKPESPKPAAGPPSAPSTASGAGVAPPSPPEPSTPDAEQAKLDAEAARLQEAADAEAKRLAELEAEAQKADERAEDFGQPRAARCPTCRERLERYTGDNPHKLGTHYCPNCGRIKL